MQTNSALIAILALTTTCSFANDAAVTAKDYGEIIVADEPAAFWRFDVADQKAVACIIAQDMRGQAVGEVQLAADGPRPPRYLSFGDENAALAVPGRGYVTVEDPGDESPLDFDLGDTITLEAWVDLHALSPGRNVYIVGKGRTGSDGVAADNQNYALRLRGIGGTARLSFLFRGSNNSDEGDWHRWNSDTGFVPAGGWHHVAVSYKFGEPESIQGYIDGQPVAGTWDMGGATERGPVVDNDQLWIGSSMGGSPNSTFDGRIDEVAIYRHALSPERIGERVRVDTSQPAYPVPELPEPPAGEVLVQVFEGAAGFRPTGDPTVEFTLPALALNELPHKYNAKGLIADWRQPLLVRAIAQMRPAAGDYRVLLRAKDSSQLQIDGRVVAQTGKMSKNASGHENVPELKESDSPDLRPLSPGLQEKSAEVSLDGKPHLFVVSAHVGTQGLRPEIGELVAAMAAEGRPFQILSPSADLPLSDEAWDALVEEQRAWLTEFNRGQRLSASKAERDYWRQRHEIARREAAKLPPIDVPALPSGMTANNAIDHFIAARLAAEDIEAAPLTDDWQFLRRATLDTVGVIPTPQEIAAFQKDPGPQHREKLIDRLLSDPRWADHWVSYWQDVLAENPNILKGKLNNTGPFRWWIYESLLDNKPIDRFATELIMMEGSTWYGGPAGFALATQNDAPLAAKAHVISKAFLGVEMKCARCHDAPYHDVTQRDTFSIAAMLGRGGQKIPRTSVVPVAEGARQPEVTISLKPGETVKPDWPFAEFAGDEVPGDLVRKPDDSRAQLAVLITSPANERFAKVVVNRMWAKLMGRGIVAPVDDWEGLEPSHPKLLQWLARQLITHDYDVKHIARLILNSRTYQRKVLPDATGEQLRLFASPTRRRMTAEQIVDSLFLAAGKEFGAEVMSLDPEGRRPVTAFLNLGRPTRAWQFASLSNERDRPALALPVAQSIVDMLVTFGWRESRQDPITDREEEPTLLQPAVLANGLVGRRITTLSDGSGFTHLALQEQDAKQLVERVFQRILSRAPTRGEREMFAELLRDGYEHRRTEVKEPADTKKKIRHAVSWSNHLSPEATRIKLELERAARAGDPPSPRLAADWRERAEDMVWALVNSPEFVFVP